MITPIRHPAPGDHVLRNLLQLALILAPYAYFGLLLAVAVHEIVGHGLASLALGGDFVGFELHFDGMGWALVPMPETDPAWKHILVLSAGVVATTVTGVLLFVAGVIGKKKPLLSLPLLIVASELILEGVPYAFWNSVRPTPPGDVGRIIEMTGSTPLHISIVIASGMMLVIGIYMITWFIFAVIQSWVTGGQEFTGKPRLIVLLLLGSLSGAAWFTFDWNQIAPGVGVLPNIVATVLHVSAALSLLWIRPAPFQPSGDTKSAVVSAIIGWGLAVASIVGIALWFRNGLYWAE